MAVLKRPLADRRGKVRVRWYPVNHDEKFVKGDWLYIKSGKLSIAAKDGEFAQVPLLGRSLTEAEQVHNSISGLCPVEIADDTAEFAFPIIGATTVEHATKQMGLFNKNGIWCLDESDKPLVRCVEVELSRYPLGEEHGVVWAKVLPNHRQVE